MNLATLKGSEKQVAWAEKLRTQMLNEARQAAVDLEWAVEGADLAEWRQACAEAIEKMCRQTSAVWWIDRRHLGGRAVMLQFI